MSQFDRYREDRPPEFRAQARMSARALQGNYEAIRAQVPDHFVLPMIKANAYGHGSVWAARQLLTLPGLLGLGVATLEEGKALRVELGGAARRVPIVVFSGIPPWTEEKGHYCERHRLTPVISSVEDWRAFLAGGWTARLPYELKFNTGMNRLGLPPGEARRIRKALDLRSAEDRPQGVLTHLAIAEKPEDSLSLEQRSRFEGIRRELGAAWPNCRFHLANSAAIWKAKLWRLEGFTDVVRPGLSLYGVPPWKGAPERGLTPVMTYVARVVQLHTLRPGDSVGYGATFKVKASRRDPEPQVKVATLSAGYADGIHRTLSNQGFAWVNGQPTRFAGRVSMDLSAILAPPGTKLGDEVELLGPQVDPWAQAEAAGTVPYELLTSVSERVQRIYGP